MTVKGKRKGMADVLASMGGMNAARPEPEPEREIEVAPADVSVPAEDTPEPDRAAEVGAEPARATQPVKPKFEVTPAMRDAVRSIATYPDPTVRGVGASVARGRNHVSARARSHVEKQRLAGETKPAKVPRGYNVRPPRIEKPHQSVYADPEVWKTIRRIALEEDVKPQDLYREGLRHVLKRRGYDFDKLDRGEA